MYRKALITLLALFLASSWQPAVAQETRVGMFNSPKGFGATVRVSSGSEIFHTASAYIDMYGIPTGRNTLPGYRFEASRLYVLGRRTAADQIGLTFYAGPGISGGYVKDHDKGRGIDLVTPLLNQRGLMLAVSGTVGCLADFGGRISLDLSFTADLGAHLRSTYSEGDPISARLSIYNNGIIRLPYPQLTIYFAL